MSPFAIGAIGFAVMFLLIVLRMQVALSMFVVGAAGYIYLNGAFNFLYYISVTPYYLFANYTFSVIPLFVMMGTFAEKSGLARDLFNSCSVLIGRVRGGLGMSVVTASAVFGAMCGSSLATTATFSRAALPEMRRLGYDGAFGGAIVASGGIMGLLIPPSVILVIYAILAEQNIAKLFLAALLPGLMALAFYCMVIAYIGRRNPQLAPVHEGERLESVGQSLFNVWPAVAVIVVVLGGIYSGVFTPTEAAGVGAVLMLLVSLLQKRLGWAAFIECLVQTAGISAMIFAVMLGAAVFNAFLALTQMPSEAARIVSGLPLSPYFIMVLIMTVYILLGTIMDELAMILLTVPLVFPIIIGLDFGIPVSEVGIWFGILLLTVVGTGMLTPPMGIATMLVISIARDLSVIQTYRFVLPFVAADIVRLALLIAFPGITLLLIG